MNRKRALLYAALALAVPLPALALPGGSGAADLGVEASLEGCGLSDGAIVCRINASFNRVPDAEYYTASVTAANGAVTDLGTVSGGGASGAASTGAWVPYVGNGTYTVTVSAWGYDERGRPEVVESEDSGAGGANRKREGQVEAIPAPEPPAVQEPAPVEPEAPAAPAEPLPECPEAAEEAPDPDDAATKPGAVDSVPTEPAPTDPDTEDPDRPPCPPEEPEAAVPVP
ncbi:MAG: hypothetical protein ACRDL3_13985 [Solirubrobacterales bacterium]